MTIDNKNIVLNDSLVAISTGVEPLQIFGYGIGSGAAQIRLSNNSIGMYVDAYNNTEDRVIQQFTVNVLDNSNNPTFYLPNPTTSNAINLTITNINNTYIKGKFSGVLFRWISSNDLVFTAVSNGKFRVPLK